MSFGLLFLSTPSARRATRICPKKRLRPRNFYPRPPRGGRPEPRGAANLHLYFYPRPPRGGRQLFRGIIMSQKQFLSTPSARRATGLGRFLGQDAGNFYPRPPRGGRPATSEILRLRCDFYPRPPRGGRPRDATTIANGMRNFYPRPPRGGRHLDLLDSVPNIDFYPRPPRGGRQQKQRQNLYFQTNYTTFCTNLEEP